MVNYQRFYGFFAQPVLKSLLRNSYLVLAFKLSVEIPDYQYFFARLNVEYHFCLRI